jgi:uncharacterized lipoprotein YajG
MPSINDRVLDTGLAILQNETTALVICSAEPTTFTEANATYKLGAKASPTVSAPGARGGGGRKVTVSAITDGAVSATGTASHFALIDVTNSRLLATKALSASQAVTNGNTFTLTALDIGIPAAT